MVLIQRTLKKYSAGLNIFWELGYQDTPLFPGLLSLLFYSEKRTWAGEKYKMVVNLDFQDLNLLKQINIHNNPYV